MRISAVTLGVVMVVVATACGAAAAHPRVAASREPVPWIDRPAPIYTAPQPPLPTYPTGAPACRASQLRAVGSREGVGMGNVQYAFAFRNVSQHTCLLRGFTRITGIGAGGRRIALHLRQTRRVTYFGSIIPADVRPGRTGELWLVGTDMCNASTPRYTDAAFRVPGGGWVATGEELVMPCPGWQITALGLPQRYSSAPVVRPTHGLAALRAAIPMASQVSRGRSLRYVVVLTNPTAAPVALRPCPRYEELLFAKDLALRREFWLNCAAARSIPPGGSERFAMVLPLSRPVPLSNVGKLSWVLGVPEGPGAVAP